MGLSFDLEGVIKGLADYENKVLKGIELFGEQAASNMEGDAKSQARWQDRTGMARKTLHGYVTRPGPNIVRINLAHGVEYGINLELGHEKRYAIVEPIVRINSPYIVRDLENKFSKL